jgi:hypothetical protein
MLCKIEKFYPSREPNPNHAGHSQSLEKADGMTVVLELNDKIHKHCTSNFRILFKNDYINHGLFH